MRIVDAHPVRGLHRPGEPVRIRVQTGGAAGGRLRATVTHLAHPVAELDEPVAGEVTDLRWQPPAEAPRGFGVDMALHDGQGRVRDTASTAFDVLDRWTQFPRYGFLCDFPPGRSDLAGALALLARHHVNGLQFYDWQYRHDQLVAPADPYDDPLGRTLSLATVGEAIRAAHEHGMAAMAYTAVYAASTGFWEAHPDWALYDAGGVPVAFEDFLGLMDPSRGSPWRAHLLDQCDQAVTAVGFDGIHLDQYGEPRLAYDASGRPVDLPGAFVGFVADLKARRAECPVTVNAVKNWPVVQLAASPQDFTYVELWPDTPTYREVLDIVTAARWRSAKPLVLALYVPAAHPANVLTIDALLLASGTWRIELGEGDRLLTDPYFPNHQPVPAGIHPALRAFHDLAVRYGEVAGPHARPAGNPVEVPPGIWAVPHYSGDGRLAVGLVNMTGLERARWDRSHEPPGRRQRVDVTVATPARAVGAWWAEPEHATPSPVTWRQQAGCVHVTVPQLEYWGLLLIDTR